MAALERGGDGDSLNLGGEGGGECVGSGLSRANGRETRLDPPPLFYFSKTDCQPLE